MRTKKSLGTIVDNITIALTINSSPRNLPNIFSPTVWNFWSATHWLANNSLTSYRNHKQIWGALKSVEPAHSKNSKCRSHQLPAQSKSRFLSKFVSSIFYGWDVFSIKQLVLMEASFVISYLSIGWAHTCRESCCSLKRLRCWEAWTWCLVIAPTRGFYCAVVAIDAESRISRTRAQPAGML